MARSRGDITSCAAGPDLSRRACACLRGSGEARMRCDVQAPVVPRGCLGEIAAEATTDSEPAASRQGTGGLVAPELLAAQPGSPDRGRVDLNRRRCNSGRRPLDRDRYGSIGRKRPAPVGLVVALASAPTALWLHDRTARLRRLALLIERLVVGAHGLRARACVLSIGVFDPHFQLTAGHRRVAANPYP